MVKPLLAPVYTALLHYGSSQAVDLGGCICVPSCTVQRERCLARSLSRHGLYIASLYIHQVIDAETQLHDAVPSPHHQPVYTALL